VITSSLVLYFSQASTFAAVVVNEGVTQSFDCRVWDQQWFDAVISSVGLDVDVQAMPLGLQTVSSVVLTPAVPVNISDTHPQHTTRYISFLFRKVLNCIIYLEHLFLQQALSGSRRQGADFVRGAAGAFESGASSVRSERFLPLAFDVYFGFNYLARKGTVDLVFCFLMTRLQLWIRHW
jgi:hypothetical protein